MQFQNVVCQADQRPFAPYFVDTPQQKLPEPARLLDLPEHWFHNRLSRCIHRFANLRFQFAPHPIYAGSAFRQRAFWGCKPKPPKIPSRQIESRYDRIQVDGLPVAAEGVVAIHVDVAPCRR